MLKKLAKQLKEKSKKESETLMISPIDSLKVFAKDSFLKGLSKHALKLYERKSDIKKFTKMVLSDNKNTLQEDYMAELYDKSEPFSEEALFNLSENKRFLEDLGL